MRDLPPIHPGEQLREEFMKPLGLTAYRLAKDIGVPVTRVQAIIAANDPTVADPDKSGTERGIAHRDSPHKLAARTTDHWVVSTR